MCIYNSTEFSCGHFVLGSRVRACEVQKQHEAAAAEPAQVSPSLCLVQQRRAMRTVRVQRSCGQACDRSRTQLAAAKAIIVKLRAKVDKKEVAATKGAHLPGMSDAAAEFVKRQLQWQKDAARGLVTR